MYDHSDRQLRPAHPHVRLALDSRRRTLISTGSKRGAPIHDPYSQLWTRVSPHSPGLESGRPSDSLRTRCFSPTRLPAEREDKPRPAYYRPSVLHLRQVQVPSRRAPRIHEPPPHLTRPRRVELHHIDDETTKIPSGSTRSGTPPTAPLTTQPPGRRIAHACLRVAKAEGSTLR